MSFSRFRLALVALGCVGLSLAALEGAAVAAPPPDNGNRLIAVSAERLQETVSYSGDDPAYVAFRVSVANLGTNAVNNVSLVARSRVLEDSASDTDSSAWPAGTVVAGFDSSTTSQCTLGQTVDSVRCTIRQLRAVGKAGSASSFVLFFASPTRGADFVQTEEINLEWTVTYADSNRGGRLDVGQGIANAPVAIAPAVTLASQVHSAVPLVGATLSTWSEQGLRLPSATDPWMTTVRVPGAVAGFRPVSLTESHDAAAQSPVLTDRRVTALAIPDTNYSPARILITLRRDVSTVEPGSDIAAAPLSYTPMLDGDLTAEAGVAPVPLCTTTPSDGPYLDPTGVFRPCLRSRAAVTSTTGTGWTGYWEWVLEAHEGGRFIN